MPPAATANAGRRRPADGGSPGSAGSTEAALVRSRPFPGAPQRAHSCRAGAYPATASERSKKASSTSPGACCPSPRVRSPPMRSSNWRSAGSFSTGVNRSAVSSIATPAV